MTVYNDPPIFKQPLVSTITVAVGFNYTYALPEVEDKEGMTVIITSYMRSGSRNFPSFIKFSAA